MASNSSKERSERENEEEAVSMVDVLQEEQQLEEDANAVLGDSDDKNCTYHQGYVARQALYACATCVGSSSDSSGVCLACSLDCHDGHQLYELYTKRHFRCDCGNGKFGEFKCKISPEKEVNNAENCYNQNFRGLYCTCSRPYPDPEDKVEDEMIQCVVCEDWHHGRHLGSSIPANDQYDEMICCGCMDRCQFLWSYSGLCTGKPDTSGGQIHEDDSNVQKCQACLSTLLHLNEVSTPEDKRHEIVDLVQQLLDNNVEAAQFESKARELLQTQSEPFLVPFLNKNLSTTRWSLHKENVKIPGITPPGEAEAVTEPSSADEACVKKTVDFLTAMLELASQLDPEMHTNLQQAVQQLVDNKVTAEDFHKKLKEVLTADKSAHFSPMLETSLPKLRWLMLHGDVKFSGITTPPESTPVKSPSEKKENGTDAPVEVVEGGPSNTADLCHLKAKSAEDVQCWQGATFWPEHWRSKLCQCTECMELYKSLRVIFLLDESDTIHAYEERGKKRVAPMNQYEKGMRALSGMDRTQQVEVLHEYNDLKSELSEYLKKFAESGKVVREEDIREFFSDLQAKKKQKTSGGMQYFCK